jgi:serine/threonine protein kinase
VAHFIPPTRTKGKRSFRPDFDIDVSLFPVSDLLKTDGTPSFLAPEVVWFDDNASDESDLSPSPSYETISPSSVGSHSNETTGPSIIPKKRPPITKAIDIWSLGITFYCFLFGRTPFKPASTNENIHHNEYVLYNQICKQDWPVDEYMGADRIPTGGREGQPKNASSESSNIIDLLVHMLQKDPKQRISLIEIKVSAKDPNTVLHP